MTARVAVNFLVPMMVTASTGRFGAVAQRELRAENRLARISPPVHARRRLASPGQRELSGWALSRSEPTWGRGRPAKNAPARPAHERVRKLKGHPLCTVEEPRRPGLRQVPSKERSVDRTGGSAQRGPELGQFSHLAHPISLSKNVHASPTGPVRMVQRAFRRRKRRPPPSPR
ncbi:conserved hypothetical protein [Mycobacterium tuberculosis variant africanum K85]|uniref:Uncharacterized protein n=1 Tax=Mycobacterium tuberculosis variant africanum K85 TaxID=611304 RepID=A0A9P2HAR3_MYCTX|nr:conserved hypothetical protein [Mycobacterium tuberculosis variant africanum K85]